MSKMCILLAVVDLVDELLNTVVWMLCAFHAIFVGLVIIFIYFAILVEECNKKFSERRAGIAQMCFLELHCVGGVDKGQEIFCQHFVNVLDIVK